MYKKVDCLLLPFSASALYNNLAIKAEIHKKPEAVAVIHHDTACIVPTKASIQNKTKYIRCLNFSTEKNIHVTQVCNIVFALVNIRKH